MQKLHTVRILWICAGAAVLSGGCASTQTTSGDTVVRQTGPAAEGQSALVHAVFFDLREDLSAADRDAFLQDLRGLAVIPTVRRVEVGLRDARFDREVNEQTFGIGLVVYFDDKAGHDVYQDHPVHTEFVERNQGKWTRVRVFDFNTIN